MRGDDLVRWPVTSHEVLGRGGVSDFVEDYVTTPSGESMRRQYLTHPGAVAIVAWDEERDEVAIVRQYRHPVGMEMVEIPAGLLDVDGEDYADAAARELAEEAELAADTWHVLVDTCTSPGGLAENLRVFLARGLRPADRPDGFVLEGEEAHMDHSFVPRAELIEAIFEGRCASPTLVSGLLSLEAARLGGRLADLRPADAPWAARSA